MPPTSKSTMESTDDETKDWPKYLLAGIGTIIGLIILGLFIWFLIRFIKKRNRKFAAESDEETLQEQSSICPPSNSTVIQIESQVESSVISEQEKTKSIEDLRDEKSLVKIQSSTSKTQQSAPPPPQAAAPTVRPPAEKLLSKSKVVTPAKQIEEKPPSKKETETRKHVAPPKKAEIVVVKKVSAEEESHQGARSKLEDVSKDLSKEIVSGEDVKKDEIKAIPDAVVVVGEKLKETENVQNTSKERIKKEGESVKVVENVSTEDEEDLKKKKQEEKREKLKKQFTEKAEKKKQKKQKGGNNKLKQFDSKESWSDPPNSADIYIKTVKPEMPLFISRTELSSPAATKSASIWSVLRHSVGKDLSRVTVPIHFNEPLSYLQRLAEYMEYISLIKEASATEDPVKRLELVSAFALSNVSSNNVRLSKPFNPLLHETFEFSKPEFGYKFIAEQVSHHPPISAFYSKGDEFEFYGNVEPKIKFWGRSLEDNPNAFFTLHLKSHNEIYTWKAASFSLHNLIMGKMYISLTGCFVIKCAENNLQTKIKFRGAGKQSGGGTDTMFIGEVLKGKKPIRTIYGNWAQYIASTPYDKFVEFKIQWEKEYRIVEKHKNFDLVTLFPSSRLLWRINKKPPNCKEYYNLPYFSLALNEMLPDSSNLPKTDVRFRPDIRQMEEGNLDLASHEKQRLEEKQRTTAKEKDEPPEPQWFSIGSDKGSQKSDAYIFNGKYWNREFSHCEDIY